MGAVYKAEHQIMKRPVALKVINQELVARPAAVERFHREVLAAARLAHPNIVTAFDADQAGGTHFLVMEYVDGVSLARLVAERGPLPIQDACDYICQAALALQHAHEQGMVHRDIKPQNLMLTPQGQVKVLDFGLAQLASELAVAHAATSSEDSGSASSGSITHAGAMMGTPDYIAPEQARDAHGADIRADIYSLGCTLYDLLAGHAPFPEGTALQKVMGHIERPPTPLGDLRDDVPSSLAQVVERMMAKDPADRYQTPAEVAEALTPFAGHPRESRKRRWPALVVAAALALLIPPVSYFFGATIIRIATNRGEIEIETNDPGVVVLVNQQGLVLRDLADDRSYRIGIGRTDLKGGKYAFDVTESPQGLEFSTTEFTLRRGKELRVTVRLPDEVKIQGTWKVVAVELAGQHMSEIIKQVQPRVRFDGREVIAQGNVPTKLPEVKGVDLPFQFSILKSKLKDLKTLDARGVFSLHSDRQPKEIDISILSGPGGIKYTALGIYRLDGNKLMFSAYAEPNRADQRPTEFATRPGALRVLMTLERVTTAELGGKEVPKDLETAPKP
jgi:uncharacterized protein (TIGR03067 family)